MLAACAAFAVALVGCTGTIASDDGPGSTPPSDTGDGDGGDDRGPPPEVVPGEYCEDERPVLAQLRMLTRTEYRNTVNDLLGIEVDISTIPVEPRVHGFANNAAAMAVTSRHLDAFLALAEQSVERVLLERRERVYTCDPADDGCPRQFVTDFGKRAFRRPLRDTEIADYLGAFEGVGFDEGVQIAATAMLVSTEFLYRSEIGDGGGSIRTLSPYEVASSLSYLFWGTMPDAELMAAADSGALATPEDIEAQARRLLADPRARPQVAEFVGQWLRTDGLSASKDATIYPDFSDEVREAMFEEADRFAIDVVFERNGSFGDLLVSDYVIANRALAEYYGLTPQGDGFARVEASPMSGRGGILGLGAVLASHAHPNESSPIKRGVFMRERILCQDMIPPPPDIDATPPGLDPTLTTRERFARHTADPACFGCHQFIDGVGFGFEGFDGAGGRRFTENGLPVDMSGSVVGLEDLSGSEVPFDDVPQLAQILAESKAAQNCLPLQYFRFARGVEETQYDSCTTHNLALRFADGQLNLQELLVAITTQTTFTQRQAL